MYVVCRKRNLTCPRVVSWFINQVGCPLVLDGMYGRMESLRNSCSTQIREACPAITGAHCLNLLQVAYKLCIFAGSHDVELFLQLFFQTHINYGFIFIFIYLESCWTPLPPRQL